MESPEPYCGATLLNIGKYYKDHVLAYISLPTCVIGVILNSFNITVFTRKTILSPPNLIFAHLSFLDFLVLLARIPYVWLVNVRPLSGFDIHQSYGWTVFYICCNTFIVTVQFTSIFLTTMLAAWRYIAVVHPLKERSWCSMKKTRNVVIAGYVVCTLLYVIPQYLTLRIETTEGTPETYSLAAIQEGGLIKHSTVDIIHAVIIRLLPSVVLAGFTIRLVISLLKRETHQEQSTTEFGSVQNTARNVKMKQDANRSTTILLVVVLLFFIAEFPRGILNLLRVGFEHDEKSEEIHGRCYAALVQIFTTLTDINLSITFIVYSTLSKQFWATFKLLSRCAYKIISRIISRVTCKGKRKGSGSSSSSEANVDTETKTDEV
ncbi:FMRFamide peptide receptor frpr-18-like [Planococcus citri]|uniref:FMRFamide peptide receptor frpr-18-like n=1 Tax=Planococcus citri TaxID=170843 RepID=UPI0031F92678